MILRLLTIALLGSLLGQVATARDLFVDNVRGDDRLAGRRPDVTHDDGPMRTIGRALERAGAGDRIVVAATGVPYQESISLVGGRHSTDGFRPFIIEGNGAVLDGTVAVPPTGWQVHRGDVFRFTPWRKAYQQLYLDGRPLVRRAAETGGSVPPLEPLEYFFNGSEIFFRVEWEKMPDEYPLMHTGLQTGITLYRVHGVVIADLVVQGFRQDGINAHDGATDCRLVGLTSRGNGRAGLAVCGASRVKIEDGLVGDNAVAQLYVEGQSWVDVRSTELLPQLAPAIVHEGGRVMIDGQRYESP